MERQDFLVEIGTEELPPKALKNMRDGFRDSLITGIKAQGLSFENSRSFATPRRLAVIVEGLSTRSPDEEVCVEGPPKSVALDADGNYTRAAEAFAKKSGTTPDKLAFENTAKGEKLVFRHIKSGVAAAECLSDIVGTAIKSIPVPKRMRWGSSRDEFSRPIQWLVLLLGSEVVPCQLYGLTASNLTRGHRVHADDAIEIEHPASYENLLRDTGYVIADYEQRWDMIGQQILALAMRLGGEAIIDNDLLDEVCGLVEYPVALSGSFDEDFLAVPKEALISSMQEHQKYFPVNDKTGQLMPNFIFISNIDSDDPAQVVSGNQRVIRPRLADAAFFYETDRKTSLEARLPQLDRVVFQTKLGSIGDKTRRIARLAIEIGKTLGANTDDVNRAAVLCKADLVSEMVLEFSDLQGIAGSYYAQNDGESDAVAEAIKQHYQPKFQGDALPESDAAAAIALADRIDSLTGIFGIGQAPTGSKDPFALRRAALAVIRIIQEKQYRKLALTNLLSIAIDGHGESISNEKCLSDVSAFINERYRAIYQEKGISTDCLTAVLASANTEALLNPYDIDLRVAAVSEFRKLASAEALAAANKRVSNLLNKVDNTAFELNPTLLEAPAEIELSDALSALQPTVNDAISNQHYAVALEQLATLKDAVDKFFDQVMVMDEDIAKRNNRLALLSTLHKLFSLTADISELQF